MRFLSTLVTASLLIAPLGAQQPTTIHARLTAEAAPNGPRPALDRLEHSGQTAWLAYTIPTEKPITLGSRSSRVTYLEDDQQGNWKSGNSDNLANVPEDHALLLFRIADHRFGKLRVESPSRTLDAAGLPILFLTGVSPESSLDLLQSLALSSDPGSHPLRDAAVFSISLHRSSATIPTLTSLAEPGHDPDLREKAAFWLANSHDPEAFATLQHLARTDADPRFREKLTFDLTLVKQPTTSQVAALNELIRMAHADPAPNVRKQAQFWMGTLGGKRITADLRSSAESDPSSDVRRSAVFALSRLPEGEATPQLIRLAQTSPDADVRKQAVFWLSQSEDPNALTFLTKLLQP